MRMLSLFSGIGGLDLGIKEAFPDARTIAYVEANAYCRGILLARMRDGDLDVAPIAHDVRSFDGRPWAGVVDGILGGFPCQNLSVAGDRSGLAGEQSGLWWAFARIIGEIRPQIVAIENVPGIFNRALGDQAGSGDLDHAADEPDPDAPIGAVLRSLAEMGYDAEWGCLPASAVGASHPRLRWFLLAHPDRARQPQPGRSLTAKRRRSGDLGQEPLAHLDGLGCQRAEQSFMVHEGGGRRHEQTGGCRAPFPPGKPDNDADRAAWLEYIVEWPHLGALDADGVLNVEFLEPFMGYPCGWTEPGSKTQRIGALGRTVVPDQAALAFRILWNRIR